MAALYIRGRVRSCLEAGMKQRSFQKHPLHLEPVLALMEEPLAILALMEEPPAILLMSRLGLLKIFIITQPLGSVCLMFSESKGNPMCNFYAM